MTREKDEVIEILTDALEQRDIQVASLRSVVYKQYIAIVILLISLGIANWEMVVYLLGML